MTARLTDRRAAEARGAGGPRPEAFCGSQPRPRAWKTLQLEDGFLSAFCQPSGIAAAPRGTQALLGS